MQRGEGGLTTILNQETAKQIIYRPFPVNRLNNNVGERSVRGIPYVRDSNFRNMDVNQTLSRDSKFFFRQGNEDTPRLGESLPSLPDGRTRDMMKRGGAQSSLTGVQTGPPIADSTGSGNQHGENIFKDVAKGVKKAAKSVKRVIKKDAKKVKKAAKFVKRVVKRDAKKVGIAVKKGAKFVKKHKLISKGADIVGKVAGFLGQPEITAAAESVSQGARMVGLGQGQLQRAQEELKGVSAMPRGIDAQSFIPTHPMNFNRARLANI